MTEAKPASRREMMSLPVWSLPLLIAAAPARNCDVYDKEEVRMAYHLQGDGLMTMQAVVDWLYSAKKRGDESPRTEQESGVVG